MVSRTSYALIVGISLVLQSGCRSRTTTAVGSERSWALEAAEGFGVITALERCGDVLFIADSHQQVRRVDLTTGKFLANLGCTTAFPTWLIADCQHRQLFLITAIPMRRGAAASVQAFNVDSGDLLREYPLPAQFLPRPGGRFEPPDSLVVSGLWVPPERSPADLLHVPAARYYDGLRLGVRLSTETGATEPLLIPYETECIGAGECPDVRVDAAVSVEGVRRVAGLPTSTTIGVYDNNAASPRLIDIRSPNYLRTGDKLEVTASVDARMRWSGQNSTVRNIFAFANTVVAVHARPQLGTDYHVGQPTPFSTYLNVYGWDGQLRVHDIALPDLAVGRDDKHVYAIDYGTEGHRDGATTIRLVQIQVEPD